MINKRIKLQISFPVDLRASVRHSLDTQLFHYLPLLGGEVWKHQVVEMNRYTADCIAQSTAFID